MRAGGIGAATRSSAIKGSPSSGQRPLRKIVFLGDSVSLAGITGYNSIFNAKNPTIPYVNLSLGGAVVGTPAVAQGNNSLWGRRDAAINTGGDVFILYYGLNDGPTFNTTTIETLWLRTYIYGWIDVVKAALPNARFILCEMTRFRVGYTNAATQLANMAVVNAAMRADVGLGRLSDVVPFASHPIFSDANVNNVIPVDIHPNRYGHLAMYHVLEAVLDPYKDQSLSTTPTELRQSAGENKVIFTGRCDQNNAVASSAISDTVIVTGMAPGLTCSSSMTGDGSIYTGREASAATTGTINGIMNGDCLTWIDTASASAEGTRSNTLTVGSIVDTVTVRTIGAAPLTFIPSTTQNTDDGATGSSPKSYTCDFDNGTAAVFVRGGAGTVTGVTVDGVAMTKSFPASPVANDSYLWTLGGVTAGSKTVIVSYSTFQDYVPPLTGTLVGTLGAMSDGSTASTGTIEGPYVNSAVGEFTTPADGISLMANWRNLGTLNSMTPGFTNVANGGVTGSFLATSRDSGMVALNPNAGTTGVFANTVIAIAKGP